MDINGEVFKFVDPDKDLTEGPYRFFDIFIILLIVSSIILIVLESFATLYVTYKNYSVTRKFSLLLSLLLNMECAYVRRIGYIPAKNILT